MHIKFIKSGKYGEMVKIFVTHIFQILENLEKKRKIVRIIIHQQGVDDVDSC